MLTAAALTLDILRVINDKVAIPHDGEVHGQLADFHPLVQILEAKGGGGGGGMGRERGGF